ncbi:sugar kinase [bacterium]|nr:sugar kinase [bacterium]
MDVLIIGSIALDDVKTPAGEVKNALGGSAVYASLAAGHFAPAGIVGVIGEDFPEEHIRLLREHHIQMEGVEQIAGNTFHWSGCYEHDMGTAQTLETQLNVFAGFSPKIPRSFQETPFVFLANIDPELQARVLTQVHQPRFVLLDTMNHWIAHQRDKLIEDMAAVDMVVINQEEARQLAGTANLIHAVRWLRRQGARGIIIKKGEHGALVFWEDQIGIIPAFPLETVKDPTGAGDTFAGGFIGTLARLGEINYETIRTAAVMGTIMASFTVEDFSVQRLSHLSKDEIQNRGEELRAMARLSEKKVIL